jgi:Fuc2NAc and GlcNAc transferase
MILASVVALCVFVWIAAWWLTERFRKYALARQLVDVPNARSSHSVATPRGGGMAIVLSAVFGLIAAAVLGIAPFASVLGICAGGLCAAAIGFVDDHGHVARRWRLLGHFTAAACVLVFMRGLPPLDVLGHTIDLGWGGDALAAFYLVWLLNLTNFMDGIDGIAAVEVITVTLGGVVLYLVSGQGVAEWIAPLLVASATMGFLLWNWPPAKIFMGDAGSGFAGLVLGALSLQGAWVSPVLFPAWLILLGVFIVDATATLIRRTVAGARIYDAHRSHAYQHAAQRWGAHKPVTLGVAAINVVWLLPMAMLVAGRFMDGMTAVLIAYAPLVAAALWLGAGVPQAAHHRSVSRHV